MFGLEERVRCWCSLFFDLVYNLSCWSRRGEREGRERVATRRVFALRS